jgi:hypothetical protein
MISGISETLASQRGGGGPQRASTPSYNKAMLVEISFLGQRRYRIDAYLRKERTTTESDIPSEKLDWSKYPYRP